MATTYDIALATDKDWVRFLILDRDDPMKLQDEEIQAILNESENKYLAAALCGEILISKATPTSKMVAELRITYGSVLDPTKAYRAHLDTLRKRGNELLLCKPRILRAY